MFSLAEDAALSENDQFVFQITPSYTHVHANTHAHVLLQL